MESMMKDVGRLTHNDICTISVNVEEDVEGMGQRL